MSEHPTGPDLSVFDRRQQPPAAPPRPWQRFALPALVLAGFAVLLVWSAGDLLQHGTEVTVVRPRAAAPAAGGAGAAGRVLFQAAGWVEPEPFPLRVVPLTEGIVADVRVQVSDVVRAGDVVATLVADDAELALAAADAALAVATAVRDRARIEAEFAAEEFAAAIQLTERVEVARARAEGGRAEARRLAEAAAHTAAEVRVAEEELILQRHLAGEGAAGPRQVELAEARLEAARAAEALAHAAAERAAADRTGAEAAERAALADRELRIADRWRVAAARHDLARAEAEVRAAAAARDVAQLRHERLLVRAPWSGVVLERLALPGAPADPVTGICTLYDPARLRVRVDVPFASIQHTFPGQQAEVSCEARPGAPYRGTVDRRVQRADIQKVTLELRVTLDDPDELLRPDMLCQVRFLAAPATAASTERVPIVLAPARLLVDGRALWVIDPAEPRARLRAVTTGARQGDWIEVAGLNLTDKLIDRGREGLADGAPVRIVEDGG